MNEQCNETYEEIIRSILGSNELLQDPATDDGYSMKKLHETKELVTRYYTGKLSQPLAAYVKAGLDQLKDAPYIKILELIYAHGWHPEHIAKELKCSERAVPRHAEKLLKRLSVAIWGIDAFPGF